MQPGCVEKAVFDAEDINRRTFSITGDCYFGKPPVRFDTTMVAKRFLIFLTLPITG